MLSGYSGTGKSFLIQHFIKSITGRNKSNISDRPIYVLSGKYESSTGGSAFCQQPFSAIIEAVSNFISYYDSIYGIEQWKLLKHELKLTLLPIWEGKIAQNYLSYGDVTSAWKLLLS